MTCVQERPGIPLVQNQVQHVLLVGRASGGAAFITIGASTSVIPFPVTDVPPLYSNELALAECLNSIPGITFTIDGNPVVIGFTGNVEVSRTTENSYYVTFCNELAGLNVPLLSFNTAGVTAYSYDFIIKQYHTGNIDLTTPMQTGMVQLRNVPNEDEATDPYNVNDASDWDQIANKAECVACTGFSGDVTTSGMLQMTGATNISVQYDGGECIPEPSPSNDHPYKVISDGTGDYTIITGSTNNVIPGNIASTISAGAGTFDVWIRHPFLAPNFPDTTNFEWDIGAAIPADTDTDGYILIATISGTTVTQLVTGSLWGDRIKLGTLTADYYFARV
jgi:hypothetical protein